MSGYSSLASSNETACFLRLAVFFASSQTTFTQQGYSCRVVSQWLSPGEGAVSAILAGSEGSGRDAGDTLGACERPFWRVALALAGESVAPLNVASGSLAGASSRDAGGAVVR